MKRKVKQTIVEREEFSNQSKVTGSLVKEDEYSFRKGNKQR